MRADKTAPRTFRRGATRNGQPAYMSAPPRTRAPVPLADWLARPRPHPLRALLARMTGKSL